MNRRSLLASLAALPAIGLVLALAREGSARRSLAAARVRATYDDLLHWPDRSLWTIVERDLSAPIVTLRYNEAAERAYGETDSIVQIGRLRAAGKLETVVIRGETGLALEPLPPPIEGVRLIRSGPIVRHTGWPDGRYERSVEP